jgi:hypothetical protein
MGANTGSNVVKNPCCLVVGSLVTESWIHSTHGRKLEKAVAYRNEGHPVTVISEDHLWSEIERLGPAAALPPEQIPDPRVPWEEWLSAWLSPLALAPEQYEFSVTKAMVAIHLPGNPKSRICAIRFSQHMFPDGMRIVPTSIDVPEQGSTLIDGSGVDRDWNVIDPVNTGSLPAETLEKLKARLEKITK